jgi:hypothetical protein
LSLWFCLNLSTKVPQCLLGRGRATLLLLFYADDYRLDGGFQAKQNDAAVNVSPGLSVVLIGSDGSFKTVAVGFFLGGSLATALFILNLNRDAIYNIYNLCQNFLKAQTPPIYTKETITAKTISKMESIFVRPVKKQCVQSAWKKMY